jgi:hypothetical protein
LFGISLEENDQKKTKKILEKQSEELNMAHMERSTAETMEVQNT